MFDKEDLEYINSYKLDKYCTFGDIKSTNNDGSLSIDVFDLYKLSLQLFSVREDGEERLVGNLEECLDYIHRWL